MDDNFEVPAQLLEQAHEPSATRVLELAVATAEQLVAEATAEAAALVAGAHADVEQAATELAQRWNQQHQELERARTDALAGLAEEKAGLEAMVAALREREADYRSKMQAQLTEQLALLSDSALEPPVSLAH